MPPIKERFTAVKTARAASLSGLKTRSFPAYRTIFMTIRVQRRDTQELVKENPSLKLYLQEALQKIYENGRDLAAGETNLPIKTFPPNCLYSLEEILSDRFYPGEPAADDLME